MEKFKAIFSGKKGKKEEKKVASSEKGSEEIFELEKVKNIKKEISEIAQGRNLEDLALGDLKVILAKYKKIELTLGISETESKGDICEQILCAKEIMKEDFFAQEEIEKAFGIKVRTEDVPSIPFSKEELEKAKELNQFLILRVDKAGDGEPLTIAKMNKLLEGKTKDGKRALYSDDGSGVIKDDSWYRSEDFALKETPKLSWALTSKEIIPESTSKNYLQQTEVIIDYIEKEVFKKGALPKEYQEAIAEFIDKKENISTLMEKNWQEATKILEELQITKLTRQSPVEALYDIFVYFQNKGERLLENTYTWTSRRGSDGKLVAVGRFGAGGAVVGRGAPDSSLGSLGVVFSRS